MAIVTLLTDFGTVDGFIGAMKGVIASRAPGASLVDIAHDIPAQDVQAGAWALRQAAPWFPPATIHVGVVDPGVGTARRPLLLRSGAQLFVGPDNGLCTLAAEHEVEAWVLDRPELFGPHVSATFHGRDVFASVAGHLAAGRPPEQCGTRVEQWVRLVLPAPQRRGAQVRGQVVHVDRFGNLVTNIDRATLSGLPAGESDAVVLDWSVRIGSRAVGRIRTTFGDVEPGEWVAYIGSSGLLEIAVRGASAAAAGLDRDSIVLCGRP